MFGMFFETQCTASVINANQWDIPSIG